MDVVLRALKRCSGGELLRPAVRLGQTRCTYNDMLSVAGQLAGCMRADIAPSSGGRHGPRVACLTGPGPHYVAAAWATWMRGGIFVPLATSHPEAELEFALTNVETSLVLVERSYLPKVERIARRHKLPLRVIEDTIDVQDQIASEAPHTVNAERLAHECGAFADLGSLIMFTSGTTGKPKGVLHTHGSLKSQMDALSNAWRWQATDRVLHALPLHHIHGIVNALMCAHYNGASVDFMSKFNARSVWRRLQGGQTTVLMGVPTMYSHLLTIYGQLKTEEQARCRDAASKLRLTVSGSAACPTPIMDAWKDLSGTILLERYGMTETGMVLSNPYDGVRAPGTVGQPFPGLEIKVQPAPLDSHTGEALDERADGIARAGEEGGELLVRGPQLFKEYWRRPDATQVAFTPDGFFKTGDTVDSVEVPGGAAPYYRILGRTSVDIIKSGGFKISALRIESTLLQHPKLAEVAVLGVPDEALGEKVVCIAALKGLSEGDTVEEFDLAELQAWAAQYLPQYELPRGLLTLPTIPRNAMGKVNKTQLIEVYSQTT